MNDQTKLILALMQIDNLTSLLSTNEYSVYLHSHLIPMKVELNRQLTNHTNSTKIKK
jgi:hypothetical protein